jgi:hypothetical protein
MRLEPAKVYGDVFQRPRIASASVANEEEHGMKSSNENRPFEQIGKPQWDPSGVFRISYGSGLDNPTPFVLTVTLPYVARELGKSVSFAEI